MSPTCIPKEYLPSPTDGGSPSVTSEIAVCYSIDISTLTSFTLNYSPAPEGYDDSEAAGGRTYFLQPLALRRVDKPHVPRFATLSWMDTSRRRRRKDYRALFICSHWRPRAYTLPSYLQKYHIIKHMERKYGFPQAHHEVLSPLDGETPPPIAPLLWQTFSEYMSQVSPVPPLQDDDYGSESDFGSEPEPENDFDGLPYDWARRYRRENPRLHLRWSRYAVTPAINRQSFVFRDKSSKPEEGDFEEYLRIGTRTPEEKAADRTSSKYNTCKPYPTARSLGLVKNPLVVRFTDAQPKPNDLDNCYPHDELVSCIETLMIAVKDARGFDAVEVTTTPVAIIGGDRSGDENGDENGDEASSYNDNQENGENKKDGEGGIGNCCNQETVAYDLYGLRLQVYLSILSLYIALAMAWDASQAGMNGCREDIYSVMSIVQSCTRMLLHTCIPGLREFAMLVSVFVHPIGETIQSIIDSIPRKVRPALYITGYYIASRLIEELHWYICRRFYFWHCHSDLLSCIFVVFILVRFRK